MHIMTAALITAALSATSATPATARHAAYARLTADYTPATGKYCIRTGWAAATAETGRPVRAGECGTASTWRRRGLEFDVTTAQRQPVASRTSM